MILAVAGVTLKEDVLAPGTLVAKPSLAATDIAIIPAIRNAAVVDDAPSFADEFPRKPQLTSAIAALRPTTDALDILPHDLSSFSLSP